MKSGEGPQPDRIDSGRPPSERFPATPGRGDEKPQAGARGAGTRFASRRLILGIDPGLAGTGFALLSEPNLVLACSTVVTRPGRDGARLLTITRHLRGLLDEHPPAAASLEELFMGRNTTSAIGVAQARGAILAVLEERGVPVFEYKPSQVKVILTGYGNADKAQIKRMLSAQVNVPEGRIDDHARDAIAIALCHARSRRFSGASVAPDARRAGAS
ncbi:crossover junction endodeoxyribonuclease RuvC [bacterium]|nr:MAG: crossover junction endodeoxyribonuclease RuvC [bacterium]